MEGEDAGTDIALDISSVTHGRVVGGSLGYTVEVPIVEFT
jgi:hypothetical protein